MALIGPKTHAYSVTLTWPGGTTETTTVRAQTKRGAALAATYAGMLCRRVQGEAAQALAGSSR